MIKKSNRIVKVLMSRDGMDVEDAIREVGDVAEELRIRLSEGYGYEGCYNICEEYFGLEPDYLMDLM